MPFTPTVTEFVSEEERKGEEERRGGEKRRGEEERKERVEKSCRKRAEGKAVLRLAPSEQTSAQPPGEVEEVLNKAHQVCEGQISQAVI